MRPQLHKRQQNAMTENLLNFKKKSLVIQKQTCFVKIFLVTLAANLIKAVLSIYTSQVNVLFFSLLTAKWYDSQVKAYL